MSPDSDARAPNRNVELKARDPDGARSLQLCRSLGAVDHGELWQRDTYFEVGVGRLKLREQRPGVAQLIQYNRADSAEQRESRWHVAPVEDPAAILTALGAALGIRLVVTKRRRLFLHGSVRIHLDDVEGLGRFIEFEAVAPSTSDLSLEQRLVYELRDAFDVRDENLCATGYADQLQLRSPALGGV
jgi:adenylate cyclase class 2